MSLINDALKQTKQAQQQSPSPNPPPLSPVESDSPEGIGWVALGIVVLLLAAAGIFVGVSLSKSTLVVARAMPAKTHLVPFNVPVTQQVQSAGSLTQTENAAVTSSATSGKPFSSNPAAIVSSKPPELKLQGILFAAIRPCAIVSGRTVFAGDRINGFRVTMISKDSITLRSESETKVLSLNPQ